MNKIQCLTIVGLLILHSHVFAQAMTSGMADGNSVHSSSTSSSVTSSSYSTSGSAPTTYTRPQEDYAYQLQQAAQVATYINASRMREIDIRLNTISFHNPFAGGEPQSGFTEWNKEKSQFTNDVDNQDYSTVSVSTTSGSNRFNSGYVNQNYLSSKMTPSISTNYSEKQLKETSLQDIQNGYLTQVADKTVDKTIDGIEDENVKARLKSIKEIHNETYDLFENMVDEFFKPYSPEVEQNIDNFFKPYPSDVEERLDRFFGTYKEKVYESFLNSNAFIRNQTDWMHEVQNRTELVFGVYNSLRL